METLELRGSLRETILAAIRESAQRQLNAKYGVPYVGGGAADAWVIYGSFLEKLGNKVIDLDADTFKIILVTSSYTPVPNTHDELADVSANEALNYTRPTLTVSWTHDAGQVTFDIADPVITASGGNCVFRYVIIYDDTPAGDPLVCYQLLDNTPANVTIVDGSQLQIQIDAAGVFSMEQV